MMQATPQWSSAGAFSLVAKKIAITLGSAAASQWSNVQFSSFNPAYRTRPGVLIPESSVPAGRFVHSVHNYVDQIRPIPIKTTPFWMPLEIEECLPTTLPLPLVATGQLPLDAEVILITLPPFVDEVDGLVESDNM